jgi:phage-related protein
MKRKIIFYGDYFLDFYYKQEDKTKLKIDFVLDLIRNVEKVPVKFLKHLEGTDGLYEIKIITSLKSIRIFCCFDEGNLIVLLNCIIKKTNKTPKRELEKALKLKEEYLLIK